MIVHRIGGHGEDRRHGQADQDGGEEEQAQEKSMLRLDQGQQHMHADRDQKRRDAAPADTGALEEEGRDEGAQQQGARYRRQQDTDHPGRFHHLDREEGGDGDYAAEAQEIEGAEEEGDQPGPVAHHRADMRPDRAAGRCLVIMPLPATDEQVEQRRQCQHRKE